MDTTIFVAIITAISTLVGALSPIIVTLIQSSKEKQNNNGILLPSNVVLHRPKTQVRWLTILFFAFLGGFVGFSIANLSKAIPSTQIPPVIEGTPIIETPTLATIMTAPASSTLPSTNIGSPIESEGMMYIPSGEFLMGSETGETNELPVHKVYLDAYWIDKYEVTNAAYKRCVDDDKCSPPSDGSIYLIQSNYGIPEFNDYPVTYVNWNMAKTYCEWRKDRLPTEAEWEKAARGIDQRTYPWGESIACANANFGDCLFHPTKVGSYFQGVSPYGVYDMSGNVWEWVNDWYDEKYYEYSPSSNPQGPAFGQYHILRGGAWHLSDYYVRVTSRNSDERATTLAYFGFRCARDDIP